MASVYKKNNRIYISFYDPAVGRSRDRSTGLSFSRENLKTAKQMAKQLQEELDKQNVQLKTLGIERVTIQSAFNHFLNLNADKHRKTISEYEWFFEKFTTNFDPESPCTSVTKLSIEQWLSAIRRLPYQRNTLYGLSKVCRKFLGFLFEYNYTPAFKINRDVLVKPEVKQIITFSENDIIKFFGGLNDKNSNFKATMALLYYTGLRPSDIYKVTVENIDLSKKLMTYYSQKTDEYFSVPLTEELIPILKERCAEIKNGTLLDYDRIDSIGRAFRRYLDDLELLGKGYTLRTFRKTFITLAHESGLDLATVSKLVGHHNISTTARFYNKLGLQKQAEELQKIIFNNKEKEKKDE